MMQAATTLPAAPFARPLGPSASAAASSTLAAQLRTLLQELPATLRLLALPCLLLAALAGAALVHGTVAPWPAPNPASARVLTALLALPLWLCLLVDAGASLVAGAIDRLLQRRSLQVLCVLGGATLLAYLSGRGALTGQAWLVAGALGCALAALLALRRLRRG